MNNSSAENSQSSFGVPSEQSVENRQSPEAEVEDDGEDSVSYIGL
jgi:hypothetical protein